MKWLDHATQTVFADLNQRVFDAAFDADYPENGHAMSGSTDKAPATAPRSSPRRDVRRTSEALDGEGALRRALVERI